MDGFNFGNADRNCFEKIEVIGSGTYGVVYKAITSESNDVIALKKIKIELESEGIPSTALREICILRNLRHPSVIELKDVICSDNKLYLVFEYLDIDLRKYLESVPEMAPLDSSLIRSLMFQLLDGMTYCHAKRIMHRDLKPQNLLLDQQGRLKIADFGLARLYSIPIRPYTKEVCNKAYNL